MDNDDDYQSISPPKEHSPQVHYRRLKRLKKSDSNPSKNQLSDPIDDPLLFPQVDFAKLEALENDSETLDFNDSNSAEDPILSQETLSQGFDDENEVEKESEKEYGSYDEVKKAKRSLEFDDAVEGGVDGNGRGIGEYSGGFDDDNEVQKEGEKEYGSYDEIKKAKRSLEFDDVVEGGVDGNGRGIGGYSGGFKQEKVAEGRIGKEDLVEGSDDRKKKMKKTLRDKSGSGDESKTKVRGSNKRREEKERQVYLKELHAESQRLLRETRDAAFKPLPVVHKPISSVLEKIRKRKLEILKKATMVDDRSYSYEENSSPRDIMMDLDVSNEDKPEQYVDKTMQNEISDPSLDREGSLDASKVSELEDVIQTGHENDLNEVSLSEEPTPAFRAPVEDTQDLFDDSEPNDSTAQQQDEQPKSPLDEGFAPSLLAMNLKFDSAPIDDSSSDEEDNDKENNDPCVHGFADGSSSPSGDPVKHFVDDEAEEEDDSDNDLNRFQENEDDDIEDIEELKDMIATGYEEKPTDNEKHNELHQKWLEQQDAAGTDNLMQRLKCGPELSDTMLLDNEIESDEDDEELDDEAKEDSLPQNSARVNTKRAKQIILQMFTDKEDVYLSDDDEDTHRRRAQCLLIKKEEQTTLVSPADDESSREVFGLIKKLNIASENKKRPKASSFFDSVLGGGNSSSSSKSSFLGRVSNNPLPSSHKQGSGTFRSFIFGRDDSNSRSSISMSEDSSDTVSQEIRPTKNVTAKFSNSQNKFSSQTRNAAGETVSKTSLLDVLKRSSSQSRVCNQDSTVDLTRSIFAFKVPKKPMKDTGSGNRTEFPAVTNSTQIFIP